MNSTSITILVAALAAVAAWQLKPDKEQPPPAPPVVSVQEMGTLTTLRVSYANVTEFSQQMPLGIPWTKWQLHLGGTRVLLIARGECLLGTDLKVAKYEAVNLTAKTATLVLENPRVISARLNHDPKTGGSRFYKVDNYGVALLVPGTDGQTNAMNLALQKGQREIEAACATPDFFAAAKRSAESVLQPTVSATKWNIKLVWR